MFPNHKVYVIGGNYAIERMFKEQGVGPAAGLNDATIVCFTGGADVSPELYKEERHPTTGPNPKRDKWEAACFAKAKDLGKIQVGICRGGQFLNVMNGGSLWQDVDKHAIGGEHPVTYDIKLTETTSLSKTVMVTSTHHQMMIPNVRYGGQVWAWAGLSTKKVSGLRANNGAWVMVNPIPGHQSDCEIVFYPGTKSLCFQPHPEYNSRSTHDLFFNCLERALAA